MSWERKLLVVIAAVAVVAGVVIGGWQLGWWAKQYSVNRNAHIYQTGYGAQSAYQEELQNLIVQIDGVQVQISEPSTPPSEVSALESQKQAMVNQGCGIAAKLTSAPPNNLQQFISQNCQ